MKTIHLLICLLGCLVMFLMFSCMHQETPKQDDSEAIAESGTATASVQFFVSLNRAESGTSDDSSSSRLDRNPSVSHKTLNALGTVDDVASITVNVLRSEDSTPVLPEITLMENPSGSQNWEGTAAEVPTGISLDFMAHAKNADSQEIFSNTVAKTLSADRSNNIVFLMASIDSDLQPENPKIVFVTLPDGIETDSTDNVISFSIEHSGAIEYTVSVENGSITSTPSGIHDPVTKLDVHYSAPSLSGEDQVTLKVSDPDITDTVGITVPLNIIGSSNVTRIPTPVNLYFALFGPSLTGMDFERTPNSLIVTIRTDPTGDFDYSWSGTGDLAALSGSTNPLTIDPFNDDTSGDIMVTVTSEIHFGYIAYIQASLSRPIQKGAFPYLLNQYPIAVPDAGQTQCYDGSGDAIPCPEPGSALAQDGSYSFHPKSFSDNGDNTVTDNNTGLIWQKEADQTPRTWVEAGAYCSNLETAGQTDWRLPNPKELVTIVDFSRQFPTIDETYFPNSYHSYNSNYFWSSLATPDFPDFAYNVSFNYGGVYFDQKNDTEYVRCVRGRLESDIWLDDFTDTGKGVIHHGITGLMWQKQDDGQTRNWESALTYCENLVLGGYYDWRMPNMVELQTIVDYTVIRPSINQTYFPGTKQTLAYWSSDTYLISTDQAYSIYFVFGFTYSELKSTNHYSRCVRGGR